MSNWGVSAIGFTRPRLPEIRQQIIADLQTGLQANGFSANIETGPDSLFGLLISTFADREAALWETAEGVYYSMYPDSASGAALDRAVSLAGAIRLPAEHSQAYVILYGTEGTTVASGAQIRNSATSDLWDTTAAATISAAAAYDITLSPTVLDSTAYTVTIGGTAYTHTSGTGATLSQILDGLRVALLASPMTPTVGATTIRLVSQTVNQTVLVSTQLTVAEVGTRILAQGVVTGPLPAEVGDIDTIVTTTTGWARVDNLIAGAAGRTTETDTQLRARFASALTQSSRATMPAIKAGLLANVIGITEVVVEENASDVIVNGLLPHSIHVVVYGGTDEDVAQEIYMRKAAGIDTNGLTVVDLTPDEGLQHIHFDRAAPLYVWVSLALTTGSGFPANGFDLIRDAFAAHQYTIGQDVLRQALYCSVYAVPGVETADLELFASTSLVNTPVYAANNIDVPLTQIALMDTSRVSITA